MSVSQMIGKIQKIRPIRFIRAIHDEKSDNYPKDDYHLKNPNPNPKFQEE